ncbi:MAG: flagellar hook assembly protein FlgD [Oscillospiraceae bacterium]
MADGAIQYLSSYDQIIANHEKYADRFKDANAEMVNSQTFLNLLVAEMTQQDPLEPTSNTEFVSQMAQFTQLSYAQDSSRYAKANYAASLVGKTATASKMDGAEQITKTGVVENVVKSGDTYLVNIGGVSFDISKITSVSDNGSAGGSLTGSVLGDTIAQASMMIGMNATVKAKTDKGDVLDSGIISSVQVKDGQVNVIINDIAYKLTDIIEVKYPEISVDTPEDVPVEEPEEDAEENITDELSAVAEEAAQASDAAYEVTEELAADITQDEDVADIEYPEETEELI